MVINSESEEEVDYRRSLPWEKQVSLEKNKKWSLENWLVWFKPETKEWFWWNDHKFDGEIENTNFLIEVTALDDPFASGAFKWLFRACVQLMSFLQMIFSLCICRQVLRH